MKTENWLKLTGAVCAALFFLVLNITGASAEADQAKGIENIKNKEYEEAITFFTKIIDADPENAEAYNNRGIAYLARLTSAKPGQDRDLKQMTSDFDNANSNFTRAIRLKPDFTAAYYNRGLANIAQYEKAIADFSRTVQLKPGHARAYYYRAVEYFNIKEYDKSWADVRKAQELGYDVDRSFLNKLKAKSSGGE